MDTTKIYTTLEGNLAQFWTEQKKLKANKETVSQYLMPYANLRPFFNDKTGDSSYVNDDQGNVKGLDYKAIWTQTPELQKLKQDNSVDEEATKKNIDSLFNQTNNLFAEMKLIGDFSNYSRFHDKFGVKDKATPYLPNMGMNLYKIKNISEIYGIYQKHINNALKVIEQVAPAAYAAMSEKIKKNDASFMNSFVTISEKKLGNKKFKIDDFLDEKLLNIVSSIDEIDKQECGQPLMKNRMTESLVAYISPLEHRSSIMVDEKLFKKFASKDMKAYVNTLKKKKNDEE